MNEFYLDATDSAKWSGKGKVFGTGSIASPFAGDYDAILARIPAGALINLSPGEFWTKGFQFLPGDPVLKSNQRLCGAGMFLTTIRRDKARVGKGPMEGVVCNGSGAGGNEVCDLTIDCNCDGTELDKVQGAALFGRDNWLSRVRVLNPYGFFKSQEENQEAWGIVVNGIRNEVGACEVVDVQGGYTDGILVVGSGTVRGCHVVVSNAFAYQVGDSQDVVFEGNRAESTANGMGFMADTGKTVNLTIRNNIFRHVKAGVSLAKGTGTGQSSDGLRITGNTIVLATDPGFDPNQALEGIVIRNECRSVLIAENLVTLEDGCAQPAFGIAALAPKQEDMQTVLISANRIHPDCRNEFRGLGVTLNGNVALDGKPARFTNTTDA